MRKEGATEWKLERSWMLQILIRKKFKDLPGHLSIQQPEGEFSLNCFIIKKCSCFWDVLLVWKLHTHTDFIVHIFIYNSWLFGSVWQQNHSLRQWYCLKFYMPTSPIYDTHTHMMLPRVKGLTTGKAKVIILYKRMDESESEFNWKCLDTSLLKKYTCIGIRKDIFPWDLPKHFNGLYLIAILLF